jgi:hypothetical protein
MSATESTVIDEMTDTGKLQAAANKKRNAIAVANMTMAYTTDGTMALVYYQKLGNGQMVWPI